MSMITYLKDGWYTRLGQRRLRNEVVDGAIDTASMLFRAAVPPQAITSLALKIRALATIADPPHRRAMGGSSTFGTHEHSALVQRLQMYTDRFPALQSFINDCLEHVHDVNDLRALYLHLVHVTQMMQLLIVAKLSGATSGLAFLGAALISSDSADAAAPSPSPPTPRAAKPSKKKKAPAKKAASRKKTTPRKKEAAKKVAHKSKKKVVQAAKKVGRKR